MNSRILIAVPGVIAIVAAVALGGPLFALLVLVIAGLGLFELYQLLDRYRPLRWAGYLGAGLTIVLAAVASPPERALLLGLAAMLALVAVAAMLVRGGGMLAGRVGVTLFGAMYLGVPLAALVLTRRLDDGAGAVLNILVGTWAFDTASYFGGRIWGRRPIAPRISPKKTQEGFAIGLIIGVLAVWIAGLYMEWIDGLESVLLGVVICLAAFLGDLFESRLKRDANVKDSGTLLMGHGGVLDRFDALLFSSIAGYLMTVWLVL